MSDDATAAFAEHIKSGQTSLCRCWAIVRKDGATFGFTDHDRALEFEGVTFKADSGLSARALHQSTGLSVDNTEALGTLSDVAVTEADIEAGRFDGAEVRTWIVNWQDVAARRLQFRGSIGELRRGAGAFHAELRGLTEALNQPIGRIYQKPCTAVLGDRACRFKLSTAGYSLETAVDRVEEQRVFAWKNLTGFDLEWFARGRLDVLSGEADGLSGLIKRDLEKDGVRLVELWEPFRALVRPGDQVRLVAGCDKRMETCRLKFNNFLNYQGFPDIPGEDWTVAYPRRSGTNTGGSLR